MSVTIEHLLARARIDRTKLELWIQESWITPAQSEQGELTFTEIDAARARLISELIDDIGVSEEGVGT